MQFAAPTRRTFTTLAALAAISVTVAGCAQKRPHPSAKSAAPAQTAPAAPPPADEPPADEANVKRARMGEAAVYVDGRAVGVLRSLELPTKIKARVVKLADGYETTRYSFREYATSLGVDPAKVRGLHLYGGSRVVVIDQAEFKRISDKLTFSFTQGDRGKPRVHWPAEKINVNTTIDMLSAVTFYVDKTPPRLQDGELVMPDGSKVASKVPYADAEQGNGTRVYLDGALVGTVKRKKLTNDIALPEGDGPTKFSLGAYTTKLGADPKQVKGIHLIAGDDVVANLAPSAAQGTAFHVPARNQGQILVDVPLDGDKRAARISAVQIFLKTAPPARTLTSLDDAPAAAPANGGSGGGGGKSDDDE